MTESIYIDENFESDVVDILLAQRDEELAQQAEEMSLEFSQDVENYTLEMWEDLV